MTELVVESGARSVVVRKFNGLGIAFIPTTEVVDVVAEIIKQMPSNQKVDLLLKLGWER